MSKQVNNELKELKETIESEIKPVEQPKRTMCRLVSKADYIIRIEHNGQTLFIQPYGWAKVVKEQVKFDRNDAKYLTFVKL